MPRNSEAFHEIQRFPLHRTAIALLVPPLAMLGLLIWQVALGHNLGKYAMPNRSVVGWTLFLWILFFRLVTVSLVTAVREREVAVTLRGLWRAKRLSLSDISSVEKITFDPERDYGGYGIRSIRNGTAYIARGNQGVRITLKNGSLIIVGSQRSSDLFQALRNAVARYGTG